MEKSTFFYSYHAYRDSKKVGYGHGSVYTTDDKAYSEAIKEAESRIHRGCDIHFIAFNRL